MSEFWHGHGAAALRGLHFLKCCDAWLRLLESLWAQVELASFRHAHSPSCECVNPSPCANPTQLNMIVLADADAISGQAVAWLGSA